MKLRIRQNWFKLVVVGLLIGLFSYCKSCFLEEKKCPEVKREDKKLVNSKAESKQKEYEHKICILVPFRDRFEELLEFVPYMKSFLAKQNVENEIWIINQKDNYRFNRAYLLNIGYKESSKSCDYIGLHDVDLLPVNPRLEYKYTEDTVYHVSAPGLHPNYDYETFLGGVLLMARKTFNRVDGMSTKYWGWGLEDDELFVRIRQANIRIERPGRIGSGKSNTFKHIHDGRVRKRDRATCYNQKNLTRRRDRDTGLSTVDYTVAATRKLSIDGAEVNFLDVNLICDTSLTPWCNCTGAPRETEPLDKTRDDDVVVPLLKRNKKN
jgi:xylosylprotein 4-beta-galactosyltransferase